MPGEAYSRLYGPLAVTIFVITFLPILPEGYGTLWQMAARDDGGPAVLALGLSLLPLVVGVAHMVQLRLHYRPSAAYSSR